MNEGAKDSFPLPLAASETFDTMISKSLRGRLDVSSSPSPYFAAASIIASEDPPNHIGGCGFWIGLGQNGASTTL